MMKKLLSLLLTAIILFASISTGSIMAASTPSFSITDAEGQVGDEVSVRINISKNPGIIAFRLQVQYDSSVLELKEANPQDYAETSFGPLTNNPFILSWDDSIHDNTTTDGAIAELTFVIKDSAAVGETEISITYDEEDVFNQEWDNVYFETVNGTVTVKGAPIPVTDISLNKTETTIETGLTETLIPIFTPEDATNKKVIWKSSNPAVATVSDQGVVTGITEGQAIITVTTEDGVHSADCMITVKCTHRNVTDYPASESTCQTHGHDAYTVCNDCGKVIRGSNAELPLADHIYIEKVESQYLKSAATCVSKAIYYRSCSVCGIQGTETFEYGEIDTTKHVWENDYTTDKQPTCIEEGSKSIHCSQCDTTKQTVIIPALGHSFTNYISNQDATCTKDGTETAKCDRCNERDTRTDEHSALGHDVSQEWIIDKEPTCIETGSKSRYCSRCGERVEIMEVPALGHTFGEWITVDSPTCNNKGSEKRICSVCQFSETRDVEATGHSWESDYTIDKEPTCIETGSKSIHCSQCDAVKDSQVISALGHRYGEWIIDQEATCTENGNKHHTCTVCNHKESEVIPARHHYFGEWVTATSPTCIENGSEKRTCSTCQFTETRNIEATGHTWEDDFTIDKEPTITEAGSKSIHCKNCTEVKDITLIPTIGRPSESTDLSETTSISDSNIPKTGDNIPITILIVFATAASLLLILGISKRCA